MVEGSITPHPPHSSRPFPLWGAPVDAGTEGEEEDHHHEKPWEEREGGAHSHSSRHHHLSRSSKGGGAASPPRMFENPLRSSHLASNPPPARMELVQPQGVLGRGSSFKTFLTTFQSRGATITHGMPSPLLSARPREAFVEVKGEEEGEGDKEEEDGGEVGDVARRHRV